MSGKYLIILLGPTAVGKTHTSIELARYLDTEIISADSRQIYKEMTIGTAIPTTEEMNRIQHHFIHEHSITENYNASRYEQEVLERMEMLFNRYNMVLMTGGSGLYINAVCKGIDDLPDIDPELRQDLTREFEQYGIETLRQKLKMLDPDYYKVVDLNNPKRLLKAIEITLITGKPYSSLLTNPRKERFFHTIKIGLQLERELLYERINQRVDQMVANGLEQEARELLPHRHNNALNTVGYKEFFEYFDGTYSKEKAIELIKRNTRRYARRQMTWFKRDSEITWFHPRETDKIIQFISEKMKTNHNAS